MTVLVKYLYNPHQGLCTILIPPRPPGSVRGTFFQRKPLTFPPLMETREGNKTRKQRKGTDTCKNRRKKEPKVASKRLKTQQWLLDMLWNSLRKNAQRNLGEKGWACYYCGKEGHLKWECLQASKLTPAPCSVYKRPYLRRDCPPCWPMWSPWIRGADYAVLLCSLVEFKRKNLIIITRREEYKVLSSQVLKSHI